MPHQWKWTFNDIAGVTNGWPSKDAGALLLWAMWATDSLDYLAHVDDRAFGGARRILYGHHPDAIDLAHVRWAAGSAATAIDLCAAVLGRNYCGTKLPELALASFFQRGGSKLLAALPPEARRWVKATNSDPDYASIKRARNPMMHSRLARTLQLSTEKPGPHEHRTLLPVGPGKTPVDARTLVLLARSAAVRHVGSFLDGVMAGDY